MTANKQPNVDYALIIEAIESLKARKARPDKTRICHHLERKRGLPREEILLALSAAVNDGVVLKVRYKDYYSYRIPIASTNNAHTCSDGEHAGRSSQTADVRLILNAIADELSSNGSSTFSVPQILRVLHAKNQLLSVNEKQLDKTLRTEVNNGRSLTILKNGKYMLSSNLLKRNSGVKKQGDGVRENGGRNVFGCVAKGALRSSVASDCGAVKKRLEKDNDEIQNSKTEIAAAQAVHRARPISQRKKIRKSLGPDFLDPSALGLQYLHDIYEPKCRYCHLPPDEQEKLLSCIKCGYNAHTSCFTIDNELKFLSNGGWICSSCKSFCSVCKKKSSNDSIFACNECGEGFHVQCLGTKQSMEMSNAESWVCNRCSKNENESTVRCESMQVDRSASVTSIMALTEVAELSQISEEKISSSNKELKDSVRNFASDVESIDSSESIFEGGTEMFKTDPMNWSVDEVANFIREIGFPEQARYFREQEIDGRSLLLMKRVDVLTGLPIKLGPALKIYAHIFQLQGTKMSILNPFPNNSCEKMEKKKCSAAVSMKLKSPSLIPQI